jgi:hypothetical protein
LNGSSVITAEFKEDLANYLAKSGTRRWVVLHIVRPKAATRLIDSWSLKTALTGGKSGATASPKQARL